jgi:hypothetical protein
MEQEEKLKKEKGNVGSSVETSGNKEGVLSPEALRELEEEKERVF